MPAVNIKSFKKIVPMMYAYNTPGIPYHEGWTKIGYTESQTVEERINQQTHTAGIHWTLAWKDNAMFKDGSAEYFTDHVFHSYLEFEAKTPREPNTEWFKIDGANSLMWFNKFASRSIDRPSYTKLTYTLRDEQKEAVDMTKAYFEYGGKEFLWNAKPRFGKTLTSYDLVRQMDFKKVLIVTNRPSIANSWAEDFCKFIGWHGKLCFVSETDALQGKPGVITREDYLKLCENNPDEDLGMIAFESLQSLKGSVYFGGEYDKLSWMAKEYTNSYGKKQQGIEFDLLIIDESQEGVDTMRTDRAFHNIQRKHTLYLSGTPFKALASGQFSENQIFNWSYADEQAKKQAWNGDETNPYETLPKLSMFTYQLSNMIYDKVQKGLNLDGDNETVDYAFDLNEFFITNENGKFTHEEEIKKFLHALSTQEKYPFSTPELRKELSHTMWLLNRVDSCKALAKLLNSDPVFKEYEVVLAAGDGKLDSNDENEAKKSYDKVKKAIAEHEKTITLSVGQLTVGVTIPEWSGILMLCNLKSPSSYMQAAFRAQNPCAFSEDGKRYRKETAYVFDFDPARTLIIFDEFANNLKAVTARGQGTSDDRKENIRRLLNFFPVLGEDSEGSMVELDAAQVLSIPRKLKSQEVVRHGFMSNFLFKNISNIFSAVGAVREIIEKIEPAHEEKNKQKNDVLQYMEDISIDENGDVEISNEIVIGRTQELFGEKIYEDIPIQIKPAIDAINNIPADQIESNVNSIAEKVKEHVIQTFVAPAMESYEIKKSTRGKIEREVSNEIERKFKVIQDDYSQQAKIAQAEFERRQAEAKTEEQVADAEKDFNAAMNNARNQLNKAIDQTTTKTIQEKPQEIVLQLEQHKAEEEKHSIEEKVRSHLRGFARTIPSFIMAYGDENITLANFDDKTEDDVFHEVTGITEEQFRFLRDGGEYTDSETGKIEYFEGNLFDEVVFDDSIKEFWAKKQELANYFDESKTEDIFDYIPPQKTNQIFTPRWVVKKMVDELESNNPGCFDDPTKTFADLYMKSGLYITEIVKRLFRSEKMKQLIPDDNERIHHILKKQVYGMAPTRIIYLIATNYILGFDENLKAETTNFVQADSALAAKNDELENLVQKHFG